MRLAILLTSLLAVGCTCSGTEKEPAPAEAKAAKKTSSKSKKKDKPVKGERPNGPVLRRAVFEVPLKEVDGGDLAGLRTLITEAAKAADDAITIPEDDVVTPWNCRQGRTWGLRGDKAATATVWQRYDSEQCTGTVEKWWAEVLQVTEDRPMSRAPFGTFGLDIAGKQVQSTKKAWRELFHTVHDIDEGKDSGAWPHDAAWLKAQLPEGVDLGKAGTFTSERWALLEFELAGERMFVELDRWTCGVPEKPGKVIGQTLRFHTNRRAKGHTKKRPKDVVVIPKVQALADGIKERLGDRAGGKVPSETGVLACR